MERNKDGNQAERIRTNSCELNKSRGLLVCLQNKTRNRFGIRDHSLVSAFSPRLIHLLLASQALCSG